MSKIAKKNKKTYLYHKKMAVALNTKSESPVDIVITWVDGQDPVHREKMNVYLSDAGDLSASAKHPTRFNSVGEINYCIRSIFTFAPFVRHIFIVTDNQIPDIEDDIKTRFPGRWQDVIFIDHRIIFRDYEQYLPTFNSISIASMLWRIPGLSDQFVYFNDDIFLIRPVSREDWFIHAMPVLRGDWVISPIFRKTWDELRKFFRRKILLERQYHPRPSFQLFQWQSARLLGFKWRYFRHGHTPHPFSLARVKSFFQSYPEKMEKNIACRFRDSTQFTVASLSNHLEILHGNRNFFPLDTVYFQPFNRQKTYLERKIRECNHPSVRWICVQSLDRCPEAVQLELFSWLDTLMDQQ